jgi:hypothetical protein
MVEYISYKGEKYPIRIAYTAYKHFKSETKKDFSDFAKDDVSEIELLEAIEVILWYGLLSGCKADNQEMTLKREEIEFILDESIIEVIEAINKFKPPYKSSDNEEDNTDKKK